MWTMQPMVQTTTCEFFAVSTGALEMVDGYSRCLRSVLALPFTFLPLSLNMKIVQLLCEVFITYYY